ncbi:MAG: hypothetical protein COC17_01450 [Hyphomicrobiales bacterium]|nr:MAG: hypothetical protein COC17_01450 [Hyphomicrobiales bacterium]
MEFPFQPPKIRRSDLLFKMKTDKRNGLSIENITTDFTIAKLSFLTLKRSLFTLIKLIIYIYDLYISQLTQGA